MYVLWCIVCVYIYTHVCTCVCVYTISIYTCISICTYTYLSISPCLVQNPVALWFYEPLMSLFPMTCCLYYKKWMPTMRCSNAARYGKGKSAKNWHGLCIGIGHLQRLQEAVNALPERSSGVQRIGWREPLEEPPVFGCTRHSFQSPASISWNQCIFFPLMWRFFLQILVVKFLYVVVHPY